MNKEVIEYLTKNVYFWDNEGSGKIAQLPRADYDQAIAKLCTEQLPAGEFTKKVREDWDKNIFGGVIYNFCTRLDCSEAENKSQAEHIKELEGIINYAIDGIEILSVLDNWPEGQMKKDVMAIKETLGKG